MIVPNRSSSIAWYVLGNYGGVQPYGDTRAQLDGLYVFKCGWVVRGWWGRIHGVFMKDVCMDSRLAEIRILLSSSSGDDRGGGCRALPKAPGLLGMEDGG